MRILRIFFILILVLILCSCFKREEQEAITIDNIRISKEEFENAFKKYNFDKEKTKDNLKEFLENFINRKLILKEAERLGFDKSKEFLEDLQSYWEQSLLKIILDKKIKELFLSIKPTDEEISKFYNENIDKFEGKELKDVYSDIRLILMREKQKRAISDWISSLKKKSNIKINYKLLGLE